MRVLAVFFSALFAALLAPAGARAADPDGWYPFTPANTLARDGAISLSAWNGEPAGARGRIERRGEKLFYDGREIKLWGPNIGYMDSKPPAEEAERMAAFYRKYGFNTLRHHKHLDGPGWQGFQSPESFVQFEPEGLDRFDYLNKCLKENGIFIKLSPTFGVKFGRGDLPRIPYHAEIGTLSDKPDARIAAGHGWIFLSSEIQDLQIEQTVRMLDHKNPYTGVRYADDPFVFCVELFNEDSALFGATNNVLQSSPTLRERIGKRFSAWLLEKYGTDAAWRSAWGEKAIVTDPARIASEHLENLIGITRVKGSLAAESPAAGTVLPWASPWFNDAALEPASHQAFLRQRLLDSMVFLVGLQDEFYTRFIEAVRATGYPGEIITSNWQAGSLVGHLLNLHSDSKTGIIDRHNYFGGAGNEGIKQGKPFAAASMLARPGSGNLGAGFQQVDDCAFMLSEWIHVQPNEWYAEGPAILGAYGWGLQGWDVSYIFQMGSSRGLVSDRIGINQWDASNPVLLATLPAVSRMVRRLDVQESPETHRLNVCPASLPEGRMSFRGTTVQNHDEKSFATDLVPPEALAALRVAVDFTATDEPTARFDLAPHLDGDVIQSVTRQLRWTPAPAGVATGGYFTINTPGTKGFVGFAPGGRTFDLGDGYSITPAEGFAVILLTAREPGETLAKAKRIVLTAVARGRNSGMELSPGGDRILAMGQGPILLEPVRATLGVPFAGNLDVLDHDGGTATAQRPFSKELTLDGASDKSPYYLLHK